MDAEIPMAGGGQMSEKPLSERRMEQEAFKYRLLYEAMTGQARQLCESRDNLAKRVAALEQERDAAMADTARMDWLEALITNVAWARKSWLYRGGSGPEIVSGYAGEKWPEGITQGSCRAAIDAARASSDQDGGELQHE